MRKSFVFMILTFFMTSTPRSALAYEWRSETTATLLAQCTNVIRDYGVPTMEAVHVCGCAVQKTKLTVPDREAYSDAKGASPVFIDNMVKCVNERVAKLPR